MWPPCRRIYRHRPLSPTQPPYTTSLRHFTFSQTLSIFYQTVYTLQSDRRQEACPPELHSRSQPDHSLRCHTYCTGNDAVIQKAAVQQCSSTPVQRRAWVRRTRCSRAAPSPLGAGSISSSAARSARACLRRMMTSCSPWATRRRSPGTSPPSTFSASPHISSVQSRRYVAPRLFQWLSVQRTLSDVDY